MKGNHKDGMGLEHAACMLVNWWRYLKRSYPNNICSRTLEGTYFDDEFYRIVAQMRKRAKIERAKQKGGQE